MAISERIEGKGQAVGCAKCLRSFVFCIRAMKNGKRQEEEEDGEEEDAQRIGNERKNVINSFNSCPQRSDISRDGVRRFLSASSSFDHKRNEYRSNGRSLSSQKGFQECITACGSFLFSPHNQNPIAFLSTFYGAFVRSAALNIIVCNFSLVSVLLLLR